MIEVMTTTSAGPDQLDLALAMGAKALAHPMRVRILRLLLARTECVCGGLVDELPLAQATVSQHLKVLKAAGLVRGEVDGPRTRYCADRDAIARLQGLLGALGQ
jgi:ArsR family transcriptional regulator